METFLDPISVHSTQIISHDFILLYYERTLDFTPHTYILYTISFSSLTFFQCFLTLSALLSAASALPHGLGHAHVHAPHAAFSPYHFQPLQLQRFAAALPYHSDAEADCHPETEVFNVQSCLPNFEIVCNDKTIQQPTVRRTRGNRGKDEMMMMMTLPDIPFLSLNCRLTTFHCKLDILPAPRFL